MNILVTGGTGFIGSHLCEKLVQSHNVTVLTHSNNKRGNISNFLKQLRLLHTDITDYHKLEKVIDKTKPDLIIHLAGETSHQRSFENPMYDVDVNLKPTVCILEKIRKSKSHCKFVLGSTFIVIGKPTKLPVTEETPCNPTTVYGTNRLASEHYCNIYNKVYGLDTIVFRITNSFGPREQVIPNKNAINYLIHRAFKGEEITIYNKGKFFRDLIYVSDVISGIETIMKRGKAGNTYWISSGTRTWFYQLGKWLNEFTNTTVRFVEAPSYTKKIDVGNFLVDNSKLKSLGWKPKIGIREGILRTLDYFRANY